LRVGEYFREGEGEEEKVAVVDVSERRSEEGGHHDSAGRYISFSARPVEG